MLNRRRGTGTRGNSLAGKGFNLEASETREAAYSYRE